MSATLWSSSLSDMPERAARALGQRKRRCPLCGKRAVGSKKLGLDPDRCACAAGLVADGSGERLITNGFLVEGPSWAPNGRVLTFFKQTPWDDSGRNGGTRIYSIDLTGHNEQVFDTPQDASGPAWSPLLHKKNE